MSLDFCLYAARRIPVTDDNSDREPVFHSNITHNLGAMARAAGIYDCLWRPQDHGYEKGYQVRDALAIKIGDLLSRPEYYETYESPNQWGTYRNFCLFVINILQNCARHPEAYVEVSV